MTDQSILPRLPMTKAIQTLLATESGKPVGVAAIPRIPVPGGPDGALVQAVAPYYILEPLWSITSGPIWSTPDADADWVYQVSWSGKNGTQDEWLRDKVLQVMLSRTNGAFTYPLEVDGISVMDRGLKEDAGTVLRFVVSVTPVS